MNKNPLIETTDRNLLENYQSGMNVSAIVETAHCSYTTLYKALKEQGNIKPRRPAIAFIPKSSPQLAYVLSALLGDGCVKKTKKNEYRISLRVKDNEFAEHFFNIWKELGLRASYTHLKEGRFSVTAYSKSFCAWYSSLGYEDISKIASEYPIDFLRGIYDAEGWFSVTIRKNKKKAIQLGIANTDLKLLQICMSAFKKIGIEPHFYPDGKKWRILVYKKDLIRKFVETVKPSIPHRGATKLKKL